MDAFTDPAPPSQPLARVLLSLIDRAADPSDAKAMVLEMYERGLLTRREARAQIAIRGLAAA